MRILSDLFLDTGDATYIYNQGRCYQQNERYQDAIARFREYLRVGKRLSTEDKATTQQHILECQRLLEERASTATRPASGSTMPPTPVAAMIAPTQPAAQPAPAENARLQTQPQIAVQAGQGLRTTGIVTGAVGAAGLIAGGLLNLKANSLAGEITPPNTFDRDTESRREDYVVASEVAYGLGAVCVVGGSILYFLGWRAGQQGQPAVSIVPAVTTKQAALVMAGAF